MVEIRFLDKEGKYGIIKDSSGYSYSLGVENIYGKNKDELLLNIIKKCQKLLGDNMFLLKDNIFLKKQNKLIETKQ